MATNLSLRKIIHIDMDAYFAAVEQRDNLQYRNKPIIVGGQPDSRGVVATCSYEARKFGIHSAMPSSQAYRLCPQAIFVKPRFEVYKEVSVTIRRVFSEYTELVEPLSLDEAYLDVTDVDVLQGSATLIARAIKEKIKQQIGLIASAGVSYNKFLAKLASDMDKPDGFYLITPEQGPEFAEKLPISQFHGIGKVTTAKMQSLGIETGKDLRQLSLIMLEKALQRAAEKQLAAYTLTVKIKYHNFVQITRSRTLPYTVTKAVELLEELIKNTGIGESSVRLLGVTLSSLENKSVDNRFQQTDLFRDF